MALMPGPAKIGICAESLAIASLFEEEHGIDIGSDLSGLRRNSIRQPESSNSPRLAILTSLP